jgi:hypothetical protein
MSLRLPIFIFAASILLCVTAKSAEITPLRQGGVTNGIVISGILMPGDHQKFANLALAPDRAIVFLSSEGGNLIEALEIGKAIRLKGFPTYVIANDVCASACAFIWLAGTPRLMSTAAKIGFHAVYTEESGAVEISSSGNALAGSYLTKLGLSERAIFEVMHAPPTSIQWLTPANFRALGIDVQVPDYGSAMAAQGRSKPSDNQGLNANSQSLEDDAKRFVVRYLAAEAAAPEQTISMVTGAYAPQVNYFGNTKSKEDVLQEYAKYVARWPVRILSIVPDSLKITCAANENQCLADVLISWEVSSKERNARSKGLSTWHLILTRNQEGMVISAIDGKVLDRHPSKLSSEPGLCFGPLCLFGSNSPDEGLSSEETEPAQRSFRVSSSVSGGVLNLRDGPGIRHSLISAIPVGSLLSPAGACIKGDDGITRYKWCYVKWNGTTGWVSASGLERSDSIR